MTINLNLDESLAKVLAKKERVHVNPTREDTIRWAVEKKNAVKIQYGCLATWSAETSTGRSPADTFIVDTPDVHDIIDWKGKSNKPLSEDTFYKLYAKAVELLGEKEELFVTDRCIGADTRYALPVRTVTDRPLASLFTYNMFRELPEDIEKSIFKEQFTVLVLPFDKIDSTLYPELAERNSSMIIASNFKERVGIVIGSSYLGTIKKLMFTAMNYYLPNYNILPLHCSSNVDDNENVSIFLGLSGTGKTTLSSDPDRKLLGDDEHAWCEQGVFNFENGCYAKTLNLTAKSEPEIYKAIFDKKEYLKNGAILENAMVYPNGTVDLFDSRFTANGRASYPLDALQNIRKSSQAEHPRTILFLTADASGVLPPISRLEVDQAKLWFLMGYTSKVAGTENGITEPEATFSRFFGEPFMPSYPSIYMKLLGDKMATYKTNVYLVNTGWIGGVYGKGGERISLKYTRAMVEAANKGLLENVNYKKEAIFNLSIPESCPNVPAEILRPMNNWEDKEAYKKEAESLAAKFAKYFKENFGTHAISDDIVAFCPGL